VALAARGARETDRGVEPLDDPDLEAPLKERARRIYVQAALLAAAATALAWFLFPR
jgi:hypothetical protein